MEAMKLKIYATPEIYDQMLQSTHSPAVAEAIEILVYTIIGVNNGNHQPSDGFICKHGLIINEQREPPSKDELILIVDKSIYIFPEQFRDALKTALPIPLV